MSRTLEQIYIDNPIVTNTATDLMYFSISPYSAGNDAGMAFSDFAAQFISSSGILSPANGGTGVNNGTSTITLGGNFEIAGAFTSQFTMTGNTAVTFPTSGTLATTSQLPTPAALTEVDDTNVTLTLGGSPATALLQATSITAGWTGQLAVTRGGTGVSSVTTAPTATAFAGWDANRNLSADNFIAGYTTTATAAATTTLTVDSTQLQFFTGTTTQTVVLPVTSTLVLGQQFTIRNNSTGVVTVQSSGLNTIQAMAANTQATFTCILTSGTTAASWNLSYRAASFPLSLALGGTNAALTASNGGIVYSTASAFAVLAGTPTAGRILRSGASTVPSWSTTTYPATNAINTLLYASAANVMSELPTANDGILVTSAAGVPSIGNTVGAGLTMPSVTFNTTTGIVGTTTNNNAAAGSVGEFVSSEIPVASAITFSDLVAANVTSISLTAGDWDVFGQVRFTSAGLAAYVQCWVSTTSATSPDTSLTAIMVVTSILGANMTTPFRRISIASTTTVYLSGLVDITSGTWTGSGGIYARRVR